MKTPPGESGAFLGEARNRAARFIDRSAGLGRGSNNQSENAQGAGLRSLALYRELVLAAVASLFVKPGRL